MRLPNGNAFITALTAAGILWVLLPAHARAERLPIKTYTTADGLPDDNINRIVQDSKGFLWFCSSEGLSRFDGYEFTNYGIAQGLPGRRVNDFLEARNGFYWVATNRGLCRFIPDPIPLLASDAGGPKPGRFVACYPSSGSPRARVINAICEDHDGVIWCATEAGLYRVDQASGRPAMSLVDIIEPGPATTGAPLRVFSVMEDRARSVWAIGWTGFFRLRPDGAVEKFTTDPTQDATLFQDRDGTIWVASRSGLSQLVSDPAPSRSLIERKYTIKDGLAGTEQTSILQSADGSLWIGGAAGLTRFVRGANGQAERFQTYKQTNGLASVTALCEDRDHNLWIGVGFGGVVRLAVSGFVSYNHEDGLGGPGATEHGGGAIFEDRSGELCVWTGLAPNVIVGRFDGGRFTPIQLTLPPGITYWGWGWYQVLFQDRSEEWWLATGQGLVRYPALKSVDQLAHARPKAVYTVRDGLPANELFRIFGDSRGDVWISNLGNAACVLTRWDRATETFHRYTPVDGIPRSAPTAFGEDSAGNIWIGFYDGGLMRYKDGRFTSFPVAEGFPPGFVGGIYLDHAGRLWVATGEGGVARVDLPDDDHPAFRVYATAEGLASNIADSVTEDRWGSIYIGTYRGVDKLDPDSGRIRHYTVADGLVSNAIGASFRDHNGSLWFASVQGVSRFDPQPERPAPPPPVFITAFRVAGVPFPVSELGAASIAGPELSATRNDLQIDFAGLSFAAGESLRYQYKLEGSLSEWSVPSDQRSINYANLAPGSYRFLVRAVNSVGAASEAPAVVSFRILPPVWKRWWFLLASIASVAAIGLAFARNWLARMRTEQESDRRYRTLAETASDAIITIDAAGRIVVANQAAERTFGYDIGELFGRDLTILMPEYLRQLHSEGFARYQQTGVRHISWQGIELVGLHKNGAEIPLEISFGEFTKDGRRFFTGIVRDVTERKRVEQERRHAEEALRKTREERLAELEQVRRRIATDLHDDIGSSLTQISILSEVVLQKTAASDPAGGEPLSMIARSSRELVDSMSDIVWAINPQKDHLSDLAQRMRRFASDVLTARNIAFEFREPDEGDDVVLGANIRREVYLIFKESVNNLVHHSGCTEAGIEFQVADGLLKLQVRDNGKGLDVGQDSEGHGLASMRERAEGIGGRFEIDSHPGEGTTITLELPLQ